MSKMVILSLLKMKPMHGYDIQTIIQESKMDKWAHLLSGSIYYALNKMESEGLIETVREERTGAKIRKIYGITQKGEDEFRSIIKENLTMQPHSLKSDFALALSFIEQVPREQALDILEKNLETLKRTKEEWEMGKKLKSHVNNYTLMDLVFENAFSIMDADIKLIQDAIDFLKEK